MGLTAFEMARSEENEFIEVFWDFPARLRCRFPARSRFQARFRRDEGLGSSLEALIPNDANQIKG